MIAAATFYATFSSIGGFKANSLTDRMSNWLGASTLVLLAGLLIIENGKLLRQVITARAVTKSLFNFSSVSIPFLVGLAFFSLFNIVDMTNWQTVSANSLESEDPEEQRQSRRAMRGAMIKAALLFLVAPVFIGTLLGYFLQLLKRGTQDQPQFMVKLVRDVLPVGEILGVTVLGIVTFAFLASSLAGIDSWLLACTQTLSWDLIDYETFKNANFRVDGFQKSTHLAITRRARLALYLVGIGGAVLVYLVSTFWQDIFALQFPLFGGGLAMLPCLVYGLFRGNPTGSKFISRGALISIIAGYGVAISIFGVSIARKDPSLVEPLPVVSLLVAVGNFQRQPPGWGRFRQAEASEGKGYLKVR